MVALRPSSHLHSIHAPACSLLRHRLTRGLPLSRACGARESAPEQASVQFHARVASLAAAGGDDAGSSFITSSCRSDVPSRRSKFSAVRYRRLHSCRGEPGAEPSASRAEFRRRRDRRGSDRCQSPQRRAGDRGRTALHRIRGRPRRSRRRGVGRRRVWHPPVHSQPYERALASESG